MTAPQRYGDAAGESIDNTLGKVGHPLGTGLSYATAPVGNVVDSLVGGVMRSGELAQEVPEWGAGVGQTVRDYAGTLTGQGQEALQQGQESMQSKLKGDVTKKVQDSMEQHRQDAMSNVQESIGDGIGGEGATKKVQDTMEGLGEGQVAMKKVQESMGGLGEAGDSIRKAQGMLGGHEDGEDATKSAQVALGQQGQEATKNEQDIAKGQGR